MATAAQNETYEGWKSWETWNIVLLIDNEYALYQEKLRMFDVVKNRNTTKFPTRIAYQGVLDAKDVKNFCRRVYPNGTPDMQLNPKTDKPSTRLGDAAMKKVDWAEIANHWQAELSESIAA